MSSMQNTTPFLVQYSEKSIAVFGNTFPIKDQLKALKGKYNKHLTYDNTKVSGWIFGSKIKDVLEELIGPIKSGSKEELGIEEFYEDSATLIEWPERVKNNLPEDCLIIKIFFTEIDNQREFKFYSTGNKSKALLEGIQ